MSEKEKETTSGDEPITATVNKIAERVISSEERTNKAVEALKADIEAKEEANTVKMEKGFENVLGRLENIRKSSSAVNKALAITATGDPLREGLSDTQKAYMPVAEAMARNFPKDSVMSDPAVVSQTAKWFQLSSRIQMRGYASSQQRDSTELETLEKRFADAAGGMGAELKAALQEDTATEGGNLVPTIVESEIQRQIKDAGRIFPRCRQITMTKKDHKVPAESAAVSVNWVDEEGALTQGEPTFSQLTLQAEKIAGRAKMSIELVEDSNVGLLPWLLSVFSEKIAAELDKQVAVGDGSGPVFTGIFNGASVNVIATSSTAAGRALTYSLLVQTFCGASQANSRDGAVWIVSPDGFQELLELVDDQSRPLVSYTGQEIRGPEPVRLFGREIIESGSVGGAADPSLDDSTNANTSILFGPLRKFLFGTRQGLRWDVTDQVGWANYQMDARLVGRFAGVPGVSADFSKVTKITTA